MKIINLADAISEIRELEKMKNINLLEKLKERNSI